MAGITACVTFPGIGYHLLKGGRGTENIENFMRIGDFFGNLRIFERMINHKLFAYCLPLLLILMTVLFVVMLRRHDIVAEKVSLWGLLAATCVGYFLIVSKVASYQTDRYMFPMYATAFLLVFGFLFGEGKKYVGEMLLFW